MPIVKSRALRLAVGRHAHGIFPRRRGRTPLRLRRPHDHPGKHDGAFLPQIPGEAVHAFARAHARWRGRRKTAAATAATRRRRRVFGCPGEVAQHLARCVHELDSSPRLRPCRGSSRWRCCCRRPRNGLLGLNTCRRCARDVAGSLPQHVDVVENVEAATMGANDEVALFDHDAVNRRDRQIQPQRLPRRAVVERDVDRRFRCRHRGARGALDLHGSCAESRCPECR